MTYPPGWSAITAKVVSGCRLIEGRPREGRCRRWAARVSTRRSASATPLSETPLDNLAMLLAKAAIGNQSVLVHLLDGPAADLQALGQFPLAHSLRPLLPDVLPLLLAQAGPPPGEPPLGPRLGLARDRAFPDGIPPLLAEGQHHLELELAVGGGRVEVIREGPELHARPVQAFDHLQPVGQPP